MDVRRCVPLSDSHDNLVSLVLNFAKRTVECSYALATAACCLSDTGAVFSSVSLSTSVLVSPAFTVRAAGLLLRLLKRLRLSGLIR